MLRNWDLRPSYCACPAHVISGAFAPDRRLMMEAGDAPVESFGDITPKLPSVRCNGDRSATAGLYENVPPGAAILFRDARVLTMTGTVLDRHDVIVRDGRVAGVQPTGGPVPDCAVIVEASGKTLIPGLSEIHAHIFTTNWASAFGPLVGSTDNGLEYVLPYDLMQFLLLANGITRVEIMAGCPDTLWMRDAVRAGSLVGPRYTVGSPLIDGAPAMHSPIMSYIVGDRAGGERAGDLIAEIGFDFAKPYSRLPADGYEGLMSACDRHGIRIMGHVPIAVGLEAAIARGQGGIAHAAELFYNEEGPERTDTARIERVLRMMADRGVWLQATVVVTERLEGWGSNGTLASPDADWMNPLQKALWHPDSPMRTQGAARPEARKYFDRTFELTCDTVRRARAAGVDILTGTDFPNPYVVEGFSLHEELALLVDHCDFTPAEVLEASTRRAARYHGDAPVNGTVATGAVADLVLLDGDPLADINATRRVDTVLVAGTTLIRRAAIDDGLSRIRAAYDAMPVRTVTVPADNEYVRDNG